VNWGSCEEALVLRTGIRSCDILAPWRTLRAALGLAVAARPAPSQNVEARSGGQKQFGRLADREADWPPELL